MTDAQLAGLLDDYAVHGSAAIERMREADPATYASLMALLLPDQLWTALRLARHRMN